MIPGDGVGPEIMDSVEEVLNSIGAPIDFETYHLSEVRDQLINGSNMDSTRLVPETSFLGIMDCSFLYSCYS